MKRDGRAIEVSILDRSFRIACKEEEQEGLLRAVQYLDAKMREIRDRGKVIGTERIAVMAGLNITHELLSTQPDASFDIEELKRKMKLMAAAIDEAVAAQDDLF